jgi:hypothetical protein
MGHGRRDILKRRAKLSAFDFERSLIGVGVLVLFVFLPIKAVIFGYVF